MLSLLSAVYLQQFPSYSNHNCKKSSFLRTPAFISCFPWGCPCGNHFLFSLEMPLWQSRKTLHEWKDNSVLAKPLAACTHPSSTASQLFEPQVQKNRRFHVPQPTFLFPLETPLRLSRNMLHGWKDNSMLAKPLSAYTHLSTTVSQLFVPQLQKIVIFTYPGLHFLFALGTPLWQSRKTLHECKDNWVLAKPLAACTHLSSTVSQLFEPQVQKNRRFHVQQPTFLFSLETPLRLSRNMLHEWKDSSVLANPSQMYPSTFNSFRVIRCLS